MKKSTRTNFSSTLLRATALYTLFVLGLTLLLTPELMAQNPKLSIQGTLKTATGASVPDGPQAVTFRLYTQEMGGSHVWEEMATVDVIGGIYSHYLGSVTPLDPSDFNTTLYLGVRIGSYELTPRSELSYSPYALSVAFAQKVVCSGAVGDVKFSILNPTQFATVNGDCWVPMNGAPLASGTALRNILTSMTNLPDAGGVFFRAQEFSGGANNDPDRDNSSPIAQVQDDAYKNHTHTMNHAHTITDPGHKHGTKGWWGVGSATGNSKEATANGDSNDYGAPGNLNIMYDATTGITVNQHTGNTGTGGENANETRPVNMNLWVYIRIN
ncbi:MAG: hypothetical protein JNJ90_00390 [Saprospiraceae bacterium]|jgi:hypothetical protein|nr:hypothetical protein [Saprospiraceae bacterium]